ncbi:sensor histidine kinase [Clostridium autoethanogenum]|uniref:histidine kinase n=1 Tax=Clostridium autoethanogenum TaxID=84023 RepID=A0A3M0STB9_9CLOT|nr:HAMP domain-containing sensor histidine kinase [Clostridium autoethanogenum]RMD01674.1 sensor histidine kinase [Clostridium autoethanogenum]
MKKSGYKVIFNLYFKFFIAFLILISIFSGIGLYLLNVNISSENSYANWSSWPAYFTSHFYKEISFDKGKPKLTDSAVGELKKYKLSFQIVDKNGDVTLEYNEPKSAAKHYSPIDIVQLYKNGDSAGKHTIFVGSVNNSGEKWTYIIGFPVKISKITLYMNYNKVLKIKFVILALFILLILIAAVYGIWMNRTLLNITSGIRRLASNNYIPMKEKGTYKDIKYSLNLLYSKLKASEDERKKNQTLREEWIANISHDLKTPLSPIKGYAEILNDPKYDVTSQDAKKYGKTILRNAENLESIVENLNFTYQLKNGMLPINRESENLVRLLKEVIISILNNPKYEKRNIIFNCVEDIIDSNFDNTLFKRAFTNLIYNSVIHNSPDTEIRVSIKKEDKIYINIDDNGKGMSEEEVKKLFERYYRGTSSSVSVKGSGLGMAIAKQIIEAHGGKINVKSKLNVGTSIEIEFLKEN